MRASHPVAEEACVATRPCDAASPSRQDARRSSLRGLSAFDDACENSASPADAWNPAVEQLVPLPDGRARRRATQSRCRKSRSSDLYRPLHRQRAVSNRWGGGGRHHRSDGWRRDRRHPGRVADAAGIVDRAVEPARIRRPRRNAADAGILGRRSSGSGEKRKDRSAEQCGSRRRPSAREDRNWLRAPHELVIPCRLVHLATAGRTWKGFLNSAGQ